MKVFHTVLSTIARVLKRHYVFKHYSKLCILRMLTHIQKKLNEVLEKFEMKFMKLNKV